MENFVTYELAKKLKEKGFDCKYPLAIYDAGGLFYPLFTSCDEDENSNCVFGKRLYYDYEDFLDNKSAIIAPIISQVLKWLREEKRIDAGAVWDNRDGKWVGYVNEMDMPDLVGEYISPNTYDSYELAGIAVIEYVIDNNLI